MVSNSHPILKRKIAYICGAPRASTRPDAEASGTRTRMVGIIQGLRNIGMEVTEFIVGDRVPASWVTKGSEKVVTSDVFRRLAADIMRLSMGTVNARKSRGEIGKNIDFIYERYAAFQSFGKPYQQRGIPWIVETDRLIFYEADAEYKTIFLKGLQKRMEVEVYRKCDLLVCVSDSLKELLVSEAGVSPERVRVVPSGVDTSFFNPELYHPKRLFDGFTIGFVGTLYVWQALDRLLLALRDLRTEGLDISFTVVGGGQMLAEWQSKAKEFGMADHVKFVGQISAEEVPGYISGFDIGYAGHAMLQIGKMYHSPLKIYEYMAMGKPVVASAFDDAKRTIRDGETGFLFQPGDVEDLKQALRKAYQSQGALTEMGIKAREHILANHSWTARVQTLVPDFERFLQKTP